MVADDIGEGVIAIVAIDGSHRGTFVPRLRASSWPIWDAIGDQLSAVWRMRSAALLASSSILALMFIVTFISRHDRAAIT